MKLPWNSVIVTYQTEEQKTPEMTFQEFLKKMTFRFIKPQFHMPVNEDFYKKRLEYIIANGATGFPEKFGMFLELLNTGLPLREFELKKSFLKLVDTPRMSTLAIAAIINEAVAGMSSENTFVNVGIWHGFSFLSALINNPGKICVGVDNFSEFGGPKEHFMPRFERLKSTNHFFYDMDYLDYFAQIHKRQIGFYFYDGNHSYSNQLQGLKVAEPFFSPECLILVDDTNWDEPYRATFDFMNQSPNSYRTLLDVRTRHNCHPTFWNGVLVIQRMK